MKIALIIIGSLVAFLLLAGVGVGMLFLGIKRHEADTALERQRAVNMRTRQEAASMGALVDETEAELDDTRTRAVALSTELEALRERLHGATEQLRVQKEERTALAEQYDKLSASAEGLAQHSKSVAQEIDRLRNELDEAREKARTAVEEQKQAVIDRLRIENELVATKEHLAAALQELAQLKELLPADRLVRKSVPAIKTKVTAVSEEHNIVLFGAGSEDEKVGYRFTVYRGDQYVGTVVVDRVEKDHCTGRSQKDLEKSPIKVGDDATTRF